MYGGIFCVNIMYSTCNGSNDEFGIDYGGLSIESKTIDHMNILDELRRT